MEHRPRATASGQARYDEVRQSFFELRDLPEDSVEFDRLRSRIIERCLPLADHIARRYSGRGETHDDLVQVARVGLMYAIKRYDPDAGSFLGFAVPTMMGEVKRHFRDFGWSVKVPRRLKEVYPQLGEAMNDVAQRLGRNATASELAAELGIDRYDVVETMIAAASFKTVSIDAAPTVDGNTLAMAGRLGALDPGIRFIEDREALRAQLATLPDRLRQIVVMRFFESLTQDEIAERMGISQMHVSRLLSRALGRLRDGMSDSVDDRSRAG